MSPGWFYLILFVAALLADSLIVLTASGHFPAEHRRPELRSAAGRLVLFGSLVVAVVSVVVSLAFAWTRIPWYAAVIAGGLPVLAAPLVLRPLPDRFVDGRAALVLLSGVAIVLAAIMMSLLQR